MTEVTASAAVLPRRTERLVLRPLRHGDETDVLAYRSRPDVVRYMPAEPLPASDARDFVAERIPAVQIKTDDDKIILAVEHEGRVIGDLLVKAGQMADRQAEIGWAFNPDFTAAASPPRPRASCSCWRSPTWACTASSHSWIRATPPRRGYANGSACGVRPTSARTSGSRASGATPPCTRCLPRSGAGRPQTG